MPPEQNYKKVDIGQQWNKIVYLTYSIAYLMYRVTIYWIRYVDRLSYSNDIALAIDPFLGPCIESPGTRLIRRRSALQDALFGSHDEIVRELIENGDTSLCAQLPDSMEEEGNRQ